MIVCHSHKFIFVHLHKTAGTSVKEAIQPHLRGNDIVVGADIQAQSSSSKSDHSLLLLNKHSPAQRIRRAVGMETWNSYFKFSYVRHPFDRLVSLYEFFNRVRRNNPIRPGILKRLVSFGQTNTDPNHPDKPPWSWKGMQALLTTNDFSGFIRSELLSKAQGAKPQARSLSLKSGELLVDFVGKVENISEDWEKVCDQIGIRPTLPHANQSKRQFENLRNYWDQDSLRFAFEKYREDFDMFGYTPYDFT